MSHLVEKWKAFCEWQRRPSHIPQMVEEHHRCGTCGLEFQGNYCPCCGQSAKIGRYSFKNTLLLFLLTALLLVVDSGVNLKGEDYLAAIVILLAAALTAVEIQLFLEA